LPETVRVKKFLFFVILAVAGWLYFHEPAAAWRGIPAPKDPVQAGSGLPAPFVHGHYTITPLARYSVTAVVLSRERYRNDREADLSPLDLALGWGPMSIASVINELKVSQGGRWYEYRYTEPPLEQRQIELHSANTHCLPADDEVQRELLAVKRHELVTLEGYLIEAASTDGTYHWHSSLTREDTGAHACEVMWITRVEHRKL
jgi:hypothetical protein